MAENPYQPAETSLQAKDRRHSRLRTFIYIFAFLLFVSTGLFTSATMSWGGGDFYAHSTQYRHGFPSWIGFNDVVTEGELPPLPEAGNASTGLKFHALNFAFACLILLAVTLMLLRPIYLAKITPTLAVPIFAAAALVGMFMPANTTCLVWGAVLALGCGIYAGIRTKSIYEFIILIFGASLIYWWGFRVGVVVLDFKSGTRVTDYAGFEDLIVWSAMIVPAFAIGGTCRFFRRQTTAPIGT